MDAASETTNRLHVGRLTTQYLVPPDHPAPGRVKDRLDDAARKAVPQALRAVLGPWFAGNDESIWLIRRLDVTLGVNAAWDRDQVAKCWSAQIARSLARTMQGDGGENVVHFSSRAAYLAQFLADLAEGHTWGKWYYERFEGLRMLPVSAALRTAICEDPPTGLSALLLLPARALAQVIAAVSAQDGRRILEGLPPGAAAGDRRRCFEALWAALDEGDTAGVFVNDDPPATLHLYLQVCREHPDLSGSALRDAARALLRLARRLAESTVAQGERLIAALIDTDPSVLYVVARAGDADVLRPLRDIAPERVTDVGRRLLERPSGKRAGASSTGTSAYRSTAFGGLFLLLPFLDALSLEEAARDWPEAGDMPAATLLRFLILVKGLGKPRARQVFFDPLVRDLMQIEPAMLPADVARWQARLSRNRLDSFLAAMVAWQRSEGSAPGETLVLVRVPLPGAPAGVLLDARRGVWLYARGYPSARPSRLVDHVQAWLSSTAYEPAVFLSDACFAASLRAAYSCSEVYEHGSPAAVGIAAHDPGLAGILARLNRLPDDLGYVSLPGPFRPSRAADLALGVVAQGVLRAFAWRLPGFAASGLPYLYANFLDVPGSMEEEAERRVVRLGRPPLQFVLGMTGMTRSTYRLSWLDEHPLVLFQEGT